eukprot:symbB.v1.2.005188.t1/scaffold298.1/size236510/32
MQQPLPSLPVSCFKPFPPTTTLAEIFHPSANSSPSRADQSPPSPVEEALADMSQNNESDNNATPECDNVSANSSTDGSIDCTNCSENDEQNFTGQINTSWSNGSVSLPTGGFLLPSYTMSTTSFLEPTREHSVSPLPGNEQISTQSEAGFCKEFLRCW